MMPTPAVAPMARSESDAYGVVKWAGSTQAPPYPPTRSAWGGPIGPARFAMSISGAPRSISTTPGCSTAPERVMRDVPGSSSRPWARNASGPVRAIIATCARVSALWTSAPLRPMRRAVPLSGRKDGRDWPDSIQRASADSSPAMKRSGGCTIDSGLGAQPAATRSSIARATAAATWWRPSGTQTVTRRAPLAAARSCAPSSTRWGDRRRSSLSLSLAGSPSMALTTTVPPAPAACATASLMAAGNPAPPRPARPEASSTDTNASRQPREPGPGSGAGPSVATWPARSVGWPSNR